MSKSRYSKTKAAGEAVGMNRYGKQFNQSFSSGTVKKQTDAENGKQREVIKWTR